MAICESCGREESELVKVQRIYLLPDDSADTTGVDRAAGMAAPGTPAAGDIELWCASCCATFPHRVIDAE